MSHQTAFMMFRSGAIVLCFALGAVPGAIAQRTHLPGEHCVSCHPAFSAGGTVFGAYAGGTAAAGSRFGFVSPDGGRISLPASDSLGRVWATGIPAGRYLASIAGLRSRSWHELPAQADCNACHLDGGNGSAQRSKSLPQFHTELPQDNACTPCHHFPASMNYAQLRTPGRMSATGAPLPVQGSAAVIKGTPIPFVPADHAITTTRPDIFSDGYYSLFDVLLAAAAGRGIAIAYHWDAGCGTHIIDSVDGVAAKYWYRFSYDAGTGTQAELGNRREIRWDELLYQPGAWVQLVTGEDLDDLRREYREEIAREQSSGHLVPQVNIAINPSSYRGNPPASGRITVQRTFTNVAVFAHGFRETGRDSLYRMPFRPGVVTAIDVLYSLMDRGDLTVVGKAFYTRLAGKVQDSWRVQEIGFPGVGSAHGSGSQGFVYTTGNGTPQRLANNADRKQHVHSDIVVLHAPDFSQWRWIELGNPYYEASDPTGVEELDADFNARDIGFRLQRPFPLPAASVVHFPYNIFEPGRYRLRIFDVTGRAVATLLDGDILVAGVHVADWDASAIAPGTYFAKMENGVSTDVQRLLLLATQ